MSNNGFYRAFEERYYAPREVIKELRKQYLGFTQPLFSIDRTGRTFDIGCGRGEWLELMREQGLTPYGVDLDSGMLQACVELQLPAQQGDAIAFLQTLDSDSHVCITAFHVVEHVSFEQLQTIIKESLRVLKPGGLLIMETPNPENITVATRNFYLDPTHQRPIPPLLLQFLPEYFGFDRVKTIRLQENKDILSRKIKLLDIIEGVSPDYAIIAQKKADTTITALFDQAFNIDYGITIEMLTQHYEQSQHDQIQQINLRIENINTEISYLKAELQDIYLSRSWKITYPLRWIAHQVRILKERGLKSRLKAVAKKAGTPVIQPLILLLSRHPKQRQQLIELSKKMGLHQVLKSFYQKINHTHSTISINSSYYIPYSKPEDLPNTAQTIKAELMAALAKNGVK